MNTISVLLVEDNEGDILLISEALKETKVPITLHYAKDGHEAISYLAHHCKAGLNPLPDLILLDINLPKKNGHEVLRYIKNSEATKPIPVIMLTTSSSHNDILTSYSNHANCYITKPLEGINYQDIVEKIEEFWFSLVQLPTRV
ncbi:response regulator [Negadavirga shengliensis]|uniref:Response regulator n=1 Tax=Negadavirga shengliensis TaxID=1389218 RepID=A0ABV9T9A6_9BACT